MKSFGITSVLVLTLVLASTSTVEAQVLRPGELCGDHADAAIATFEDADLEVAIRAALSVGAQDDLTCGLLAVVAAPLKTALSTRLWLRFKPRVSGRRLRR